MKLQLNREFATRHLGVAALMVGLSCWFGYDAFVGYPSKSAHDIYVAIEKSEPKPETNLEAFKAQKIKTQYGFTFLCLAAGLAIAFGVQLNRHRTLEWDEEKMQGTLTGGRPLAFADVSEVDDSNWKRKGILVLKAKDGRKVTLDAWHHTGVEELAKKFLKDA